MRLKDKIHNLGVIMILILMSDSYKTEDLLK